MNARQNAAKTGLGSSKGLTILPLSCDLPVPPVPSGVTLDADERKHYRSIFRGPIGHLLDDSHAHEIAVYIKLDERCPVRECVGVAGSRAGEARYPVRHDSGIAACTGLCVGGCVVSARRRSMSGEVEQGGAPRVLLRAGLSDPLWESPVQVAAWCERHGLPAPLDAYAPHPRALRDHAAYWWAVKERPHPRFAARPDVGVWQKLGFLVRVVHECRRG